MSRIKLILACITLAIIIVSVFAACAPAPAATPPAAVTTPSKPAAPAATAPAATTTPPAAAKPTVTVPKTSYKALTYTNDQYGFFFLYPDSMSSSTPKLKYDVFEAADAMAVPAVSAVILDTDKIPQETEETLTSAGGSAIKIASSDNAMLADGKTKAKFNKITWKSSGYDIATYSMDVDRPGGKTIRVQYTSLVDMIDAQVAKEVVSTLTFK